MLVLTRKRGETIQIGSDIRVTVVRVDGNRVRIGISAPGDVSIVREEILFADAALASELCPHALGAEVVATV